MPKAPLPLRDRALAYLARREHSRFELGRKLDQAGFAPEEIAPVLDEFEQKNWLSDQRFAESYVADHQARYGAIKLAHELRQRGIDDAIIEGVLHNNLGEELERAREIWRKKFGSPPTTPAEKAKQMRFLQSRGFSLHTIIAALNLVAVSPADQIKMQPII